MSGVLCAMLLLFVGVEQVHTDLDALAREAQNYVDTDPAHAVDLYEHGVADHPDWAEGWLYMGSCLFKLGRFAEAKDALRRGSDLEPGKGTPIAFVGMAEYELQDYSSALRDILRGESIGLADDPSLVEAVRYRAAMIYLNRGDFLGAMTQLKPLTAAPPSSQAAVQAFGLTVLRLKAVTDANREIVRLVGEAAWSYESGNATQAESRFDAALTKFPNAPRVHYLYGVCLLRSDPHRAELEFRHELAIDNADADAHARLALLLLDQSASVEALNEARTAVRLRPDDAWCQATLGRVLLSIGDVNASIQALETSVRLAPKSAMAHYYLLRAYERAGNADKAQREKLAWQRLKQQDESEQ